MPLGGVGADRDKRSTGYGKCDFVRNRISSDANQSALETVMLHNARRLPPNKNSPYRNFHYLYARFHALRNSRMKTIAIINQKGGVAKTTTAINLAAYYAKKGFRTLAVDLDPQSNMTEALGSKASHNIYDYFKGRPLEVEHISENLHLIPSNIRFSTIELQIINEFNREYILQHLLEPIQEDYDICIIDCPPALNFVTINALVASDFALVPLKPSSFSYDGLGIMLDFVRKVKTSLNGNLTILGIVLTFFDERKVVSKATLDKLERDNLTAGVMKTKIRAAEGIVRAEESRQSIFDYDGGSQVAQDYKSLAEEITDKIGIRPSEEE